MSIKNKNVILLEGIFFLAYAKVWGPNLNPIIKDTYLIQNWRFLNQIHIFVKNVEATQLFLVPPDIVWYQSR